MQDVTTLLPTFYDKRVWCVAQLTQRPDGSFEKRPFASSNNPDTWLTYAEAVARQGDNHLGLMMHDGWTLVDADNCRDPETGELTEFGQEVEAIPGFLGVSVSGKGLHVLTWVDPQASDWPNAKVQCPLGGVYRKGRFEFLCPSYTGGVADGTAAVRELVKKWFPPNTTAGPYSGDWGEAPDESEDEAVIKDFLAASSVNRAIWQADRDVLGRLFPTDKDDPYNASLVDNALAKEFARRTYFNPAWVERLMYRSEHHVRDKWAREDYLRGTIRKAIASPDAQPRLDSVTARREADRRLQQAFDPDTAAFVAGGDLSRALSLMPVSRTDADVEAVTQAVSALRNRRPEREERLARMYGCYYIGATGLFYDPVNRSMMGWKEFDMQFGGLGTIPVERGGDKGPRGVTTASQAFQRATEEFRHGYDILDRVVKGVCYRGDIDLHASDAAGSLNLYDEPAFLRDDAPDPGFEGWGKGLFLSKHMSRIYGPEMGEGLLDIFAAMCQRHGEKLGFAPILEGGKGLGKSFILLAMRRVFGAWSDIFKTEALIGDKFNSYLLKATLLTCDEVRPPDGRDRHAIGEALKSIITDSEVSIRLMQRDWFKTEIPTKLILASNFRNAIPYEKGERRFYPFFSPLEPDERNIDYPFHLHGLDANYYARLADAVGDDRGVRAFAKILKHRRINLVAGQRYVGAFSREEALVAGRADMANTVAYLMTQPGVFGANVITIDLAVDALTSPDSRGRAYIGRDKDGWARRHMGEWLTASGWVNTGKRLAAKSGQPQSVIYARSTFTGDPRAEWRGLTG